MSARPNQYKYFSPAEVDAHVREVERELDRRAAQEENERREAYVAAWIADPKNKAVIDADPMVRALRAMPQPGQAPAQHTPGAQRTAPVVPGVINGAAHYDPRRGAAQAPRPKTRAQLEKERPWLAPRKPELESIIDPMAGRRIN